MGGSGASGRYGRRRADEGGVVCNYTSLIDKGGPKQAPSVHSTEGFGRSPNFYRNRSGRCSNFTIAAHTRPSSGGTRPCTKRMRSTSTAAPRARRANRRARRRRVPFEPPQEGAAAFVQRQRRASDIQRRRQRGALRLKHTPLRTRRRGICLYACTCNTETLELSNATLQHLHVSVSTRFRSGTTIISVLSVIFQVTFK